MSMLAKPKSEDSILTGNDKNQITTKVEIQMNVQRDVLFSNSRFNTGDQSVRKILLLEPNGYKGTEWLKITLRQSGVVALQVTQ